MTDINDKLNGLISLIRSMPESKIDSIVSSIYDELSGCCAEVDDTVCSLAPDGCGDESIDCCKKCESVSIKKDGKDRRGHQRFRCKDCGAVFTMTTATTVCGTHKSAAVWKKYIKLLVEGRSIAFCAKECGICTRTSFLWRHKILGALKNESFSTGFDGVLEIDEMFVRISYKGNHSKSKSFKMPRKAYKRGTDNRNPGPTSKACVLCVAERNKGFSGLVPCSGPLSLSLLENVLEGKISDDSIVITDGCYAYNQYFTKTTLEHIVHTVDEMKTKTAFHLNNVNALHQRLRFFLRKYNGVATKYLDNYLALFIWCENHKTIDRDMAVTRNLFEKGTRITSDNISKSARIPAPAFAA